MDMGVTFNSLPRESRPYALGRTTFRFVRNARSVLGSPGDAVTEPEEGAFDRQKQNGRRGVNAQLDPNDRRK